jgi:CBS domain-containing protein
MAEPTERRRQEGNNRRWHRIHLRTVHAGEDRTERAELVHCGRKEAFVSVARCAECDGFLRLDRSDRESYLVCKDDGGPARGVARLSRLEPKPLPAPDSIPVSEIMTRDVVCARADLSVEALARLMIEHGISGVPVVDKRGHAVGVVSKTDLIRLLEESVAEVGKGEPLAVSRGGVRYELGPGFHLQELSRATVADVMTPLVFALPDDASVAQAAAMMAYEGVHRVPVVAGEGEVVGLLSSLDVLGWLGRESGYVLPSMRPRASR